MPLSQTEYLVQVLGEEAIEVAHAASKVLRFTPNDSYEIGGPTNLETLQKEYNDLLAMVDMLAEHGIVLSRDEALISMKKQRVKDYMGYSRQLGVVV